MNLRKMKNNQIKKYKNCNGSIQFLKSKIRDSRMNIHIE